MPPTKSGIAVERLSKQYRVHRREAGFWATLRSVFRRSYEEVHAVSELSFTIEPGERVGFLGPNGAGKTTTLKMLAGLLYPTSGVARVAGYEPEKRDPAFLKRITLVMGQKQQLLWDLPPIETFAQNRAIYDVPKSVYRETMRELEQLLGLGAIANKPTRQLSLGERMKCELAAALLHRPDVLFLDEPTIGLDVSMQLAIREFVRAYSAKMGATTLLSSHYMEDVVALCPRVIVIYHGRLLYDGDLRQLVQAVRPEKSIVLRYASAPDRETLERMGQVVELDAGKTVLRVAHAALRDAVGALLADPGLIDLTVEDPPLEEVLRDLFLQASRTP